MELFTVFGKWLYSLDRWLFLIINKKMHSGFADVFFDFVSNPGIVFFVLLAIVIVAVAVFKGKRARIAMMLVVLSVATTDLVSARVFKPLVLRKRPSNVDYLVEGGRYIKGYNKSNGYPSSHATNIFGVALIMSLFFKQYRVLWFAIAVIVGYSRIYLGEHFPLDVIGGATLGIFISSMIYSLANLFFYFKKDSKQSKVLRF